MKAAPALLALVSAALALSGPALDVRGDEHVFDFHALDTERIAPFQIAPAELGAAYTSGRVHMSLMSAFAAQMNAMATQGIFDDPTTHATLGYTPCVAGFAAGGPNATFACDGLDLLAFAPHRALGGAKGLGSDIWGWTHGRREFALVGQYEGTAFAEIGTSGEITYLGRLHTQSVGSIWRDIKVVGDHAYIGSEALGHGVQVFDLRKLLDSSLAASPKNFSLKHDLAAHYNGLPLGSSHNIVSHASKNLIAAVGALPRNDSCAAGLIFLDVSDPTAPKNVGCAGADGYVHDAQCLTYIGPDARHNGSDVCYSFDESAFTIFDINDPSKPEIISRTGYYGVSYSHQGWVVDERDQRFLLLDDELDEFNSTGWAGDQHTVTYIWDIQDLEKPVLTGHYKSPAKAIDHNLYVREGLAYESNYKSGLRVVDVSSVAADPTGTGFREVAFFDVHPEDDAVGGVAEFGGAWSVYPYFESGHILVNSIERGLFVLKMAA